MAYDPSGAAGQYATPPGMVPGMMYPPPPPIPLRSAHVGPNGGYAPAYHQPGAQASPYGQPASGAGVFPQQQMGAQGQNRMVSDGPCDLK